MSWASTGRGPTPTVTAGKETPTMVRRLRMQATAWPPPCSAPMAFRRKLPFLIADAQDFFQGELVHQRPTHARVSIIVQRFDSVSANQ